jgi:hypothetical protein
MTVTECPYQKPYERPPRGCDDWRAVPGGAVWVLVARSPQGERCWPVAREAWERDRAACLREFREKVAQ